MKLPLKRILVPTDFSDCAAAAYAPARWLAGEAGGEVLLIHVVDPRLQHYPCPVPDAMEIRKDLMKKAREHLEETALTSFGGLPVTRIVVEGIPDEEITRVATAQKADLVVLSTHGRSGWRLLVLGSVAERVVRAAPCPVLTVKPPSGAAAGPVSKANLAVPVSKTAVVSA